MRGAGFILYLFLVMVAHADPGSLAHSSTSSTNFTIRFGLGGVVKCNTWFPVVVEPADRVQEVTVDFGPTERDGGKRYRFHGGRGENHLSVKAPDGIMGGGGSHGLVCRIVDREGKECFQNIIFNSIDRSTPLVGVLSADPGRFEFLPSIMAGHGGARVLALSETVLPERWFDLTALDVLLLDELPSDLSLNPLQMQAIHDWVISGGKAILTARALAEKGHSGWPFASGFDRTGPIEWVVCPSLAARMRVYGDMVAKIPAVGMTCPPGRRALWSGERVLLGSSHYGRGQVTAVAFDWEQVQSSKLRDLEGIRLELWNVINILASSREDLFHGEGGPSPLIPEEAKASSLNAYLIVFLSASALVLGLFNWLALRRRFEISLFTLPGGALLLALAAFLIGLYLRGNRTRVDESSVLFPVSGARAFRVSTCAVLKGDRHPFSASIPHPLAMPLWDSRHREPLRIREVESGERMKLENIQGELWTLHVLKGESPVDIQGGFDFSAALTGNTLTGTVHSGMSQTVEDACLTYGWHQIRLGLLTNGSSVSFSIPLVSVTNVESPAMARRSWNAKDDSLSRRLAYYADQDPAKQKVRVVGVIAGAPDFMTVDRQNAVQSNEQIFVASADVAVTGDRIDLPLGVMSGFVADLNGSDVTAWPDDHQWLPAIRKTVGFERKKIGLLSRGADRGKIRVSDPFEVAEEEDDPCRRCSVFRLPPTLTKWKPESMTIRWTLHSVGRGSAEESDEPTRDIGRQYVLSAFNWSRTNWQTVCTAPAASTNSFTLPSPVDFWHPEAGWVLFQSRYEIPPKDEKARIPQGAVAVALQARCGDTP